MYKLGSKSSKKLATVHPELAEVVEKAILLTPYDFTVVHGWRGKEIQDALYESGASTKKYPFSMHNKTDDGGPCSLAIDFAPWIGGKIPWNDTHIFTVIAGVFFAVASSQGVTLRYGGDWDSDGSTKDQTLMDWGHIEVIL